MSGFRLSRVYVAFVLLALAQPLVLWATGGLVIARGATVATLVVIAALGFGSRAARVLLVVLEGVPTLATLALVFGGSGGVQWLDVGAGLGTSIPLLWLLLSPAMRAHVAPAPPGGAPARI